MLSSASRMWMPGTERADPRVPGFIEQAQAERLVASDVESQSCGDVDGLELHALLDFAPLRVEFGQLHREPRGLCGVIGEQALDSDTHVGEAPGRIQPRCHDESEIRRGDLFERTTTRLEQSANSGHAPAGTNAAQAL